ncbi:hypothetical protein M0R45_015617 [Rubus argutus]|uniref:Uncharacterized protein n=1 Tax=Rubus argutus TaxID=59490 RepID=A0AAW1XS57_RUBAR
MSSGGKSTSPTDDYDDVWTPRSAADLRIFMSDGRNANKVGGDEQVYNEGVHTGFEMFRQYAKVVDPTGNWATVTIEEARALLGGKKHKPSQKRA